MFHSDARRIFVTAWLVYAAFWNPWLQSSMTFNFLDTAVSFAETGRWELLHADFYEGKDTVTVNGRIVSALPPGMAVLTLPVYLLWRVVIGPIQSVDAFQVFHAFLVLAVGATTSALVAVQAPQDG